MGALFSGLKDEAKKQAMAALPELVQSSKSTIESGLRDFISKNKVTNPNAVRILSQNLDEINNVVKSEVSKPTVLPPAPAAVPTPTPSVGGNKRKTLRNKKRTKKDKSKSF